MLKHQIVICPHMMALSSQPLDHFCFPPVDFSYFAYIFLLIYIYCCEGQQSQQMKFSMGTFCVLGP